MDRCITFPPSLSVEPKDTDRLKPGVDRDGRTEAGAHNLKARHFRCDKARRDRLACSVRVRSGRIHGCFHAVRRMATFELVHHLDVRFFKRTGFLERDDFPVSSSVIIGLMFNMLARKQLPWTRHVRPRIVSMLPIIIKKFFLSRHAVRCATISSTDLPSLFRPRSRCGRALVRFERRMRVDGVDCESGRFCRST